MTLRIIITNAEERMGTEVHVVPIEPGKPPIAGIPPSVLFSGETRTYYVHHGQQLLISEVKG